MKEFVDAVKRLVDIMPKGDTLNYFYARDEVVKVRELLDTVDKTPVYNVYTGVRDKKGKWIKNGDIVRRITPSRKYDYAQVVNVYINGAIDVLLNGKQYGWSSENVEVANCSCFAASDEEHTQNCPLSNAS